MDEELHDDALARGLIRYCPICDGYEVTDKNVGVIGSDSHGVAEALFLRSFTADVTLIAPDKALQLEARGPARSSKDAGIDCVDGPAQAVAISDECIVVDTAEGHYTFDSIYPGARVATPTPSSPRWSAQSLSSDGCIIGRQPPADQRRRASMRRATSSSASTRSATRWAKAASPRPPSATICAQEPRCASRRANGGCEAALGEEFRVEDDAAVLEVGDAVA